MENQSSFFELGTDMHIFDFYAKDPYRNIKLTNNSTFYATLIFGFIIKLSQFGNVICTQNALNGSSPHSCNSYKCHFSKNFK